MNSVSLSESMHAIGQTGKAKLRRAWDWWSGEMLAMMPAAAQQAISDRKQILFVSLADDYADVRLFRGGQSNSLAHVAIGGAEPVNDQEKLRAEIDKLTPSLTATIVQIPGELALQKTLTLPLDTEDNLANVLGFEMDRLTPFSRDEVYFDYSITGRSKAKRTIDVNFTVARKSTVDKIVETLAGYAVQPTVLTVSDDRFETQATNEMECANNLLPHARRARPSRRRHYLAMIMTLLVAALVATAVALPLNQQSRVLQALDEKVVAARSAAVSAEETRNEIELVIQHGQFFASKRAALPTIVRMLDEITRVLPDDTVLMRFEVSDNRLRIQGESASASSLISLIEGASFFHRAGFASPVTKNPRTNKDRFTLEAELITSDGQT